MKVCVAQVHDIRDHRQVLQENLRECLRCKDWVRPVLGSTRRMSSKSNLPGIYGIVKSIICCPQCGEKV